MKHAWTATLLLASLATLTAEAQQPQRPGAHLEALDTDKDGKISRAEAAGAPRMAERFDQLDANKDGFLSRNELRAGGRAGMKEMKQRGEEAFKAADANGDGKLSKEEAQNMPHVSENFSAADANSDGFLTQEEIRSHMQSNMRDRMKQRQPQ